MGRRGKESHRQRSSELLLIVTEIKGLKGLRQIEVGGGRGRWWWTGGAYATAQLSAAVIGPGVRDIREMRDIPDEGVFFCVHVRFWMCNNSLNDDDMDTMMCST